MLASLRARIRLLPVTLVAVAALAGVKMVDLWQGSRLLGAPIASAQSSGAKPAAGAPTSLVPNKPAAKAGGPGDPAGQKAEAPKAEEKPTVRSAVLEPTRTTATVLPREPGPYTAAEVEVLQSLSRRREELDQREQGIAAREALLAAAEKRIESRIGELKALEAKLTALADKRGEEEENRLRGLVKVYESMKPAEAARIFQELDMPVLLDVAERMRESKLGPILARMDPQKATAMTVELAGRRNPGTAKQSTDDKASPSETTAPKAEAGLPKGEPS